MKCDFETFIVNLFALSQQFNFWSSVFKMLISSASYFPSIVTVVSFANKMVRSVSETSAKSFIYKMKSKGRRILPCGMPQTTGLISDLVL